MRQALPSIELFQSVNGFNRDETNKAMVASGLLYHYLAIPCYGSLACWLTHFACLQRQVKEEIPLLCFLEDDVEIYPEFESLCRAAASAFARDEGLNLIRLGNWGEGYITCLESAKRIIGLLKEQGIRNSIDNQLNQMAGQAWHLPLIKNVKVWTNAGDIRRTEALPEHPCHFFSFLSGRSSTSRKS